MNRQPEKTIAAWGGFVNGRLDRNRCEDAYNIFGLKYAIYTAKRAAKARYQDVRRVYITYAELESNR
jgi:hypothetical protein